jgi:ribosome biogenesis protein MAK21
MEENAVLRLASSVKKVHDALSIFYLIDPDCTLRRHIWAQRGFYSLSHCFNMTKSTKGPGLGSKPVTKSTKQDAESPPAFDEKALLVLTEKIEKGFGTGKSTKKKSDNRSQMRKEMGNTSHPDQSNPKHKSKGLQPKQGNKRDARGNRKPQSEESTNGGKPKHLKNGNSQDDNDILLQEILAMGGTEDDLQLIADAISDDEELEDISGPQDKSLRADLAKFVAGLGIDTKMNREASESESEEEVDKEGETSGEESLDKPASSVKAQRINGIPTKTVVEEKSLWSSSSKEHGGLVGTSSQLAID